MPGLSEYPKYIRHQIFCTEKVLFKDVDVGNWFFIDDHLYVRMNYPAKRLYPRNAVIISSPDPSYCGMGLWLDAHEEVEVVVETNVCLRGDVLRGI